MDPKEVGRLGEAIAEKHYKNKGFTLLSRNYRALGAEIDLIFQIQDGIVLFVEVKSVTREPNSGFMPEELVGERKIRHISRAAKMYLSTAIWEEVYFAVLVVFLNPQGRTAIVREYREVLPE